MNLDENIPIGVLCARLGVSHPQIRKLTARKAIPFQLFDGRTRVFRVADLDAIRHACIAAGYLKVPALEATARV